MWPSKAPQKNKAEIGDEISWYDPATNKRKKGKVINVYRNSVAVDMKKNGRTVVSFKRYRIDKKG